MNCKCAFIVYTSTMGDVELDDFIETKKIKFCQKNACKIIFSLL